MNKKSLIVIVSAIAFILTGCAVFKPTQVGLTETGAKSIAEENCIKGGESLSPGYYNANSKTWWFDANLNSTKEGCNPACVVSEDTKTAEINWRCTGLTVPEEPATPEEPTTVPQEPVSEKCGIENCHGLDIVCGPNVAEICTEIYMIGDNCRQYASCKTVDGQCILDKTPQFDSCRSCVEKCKTDYTDNPMELFSCESKCAE